MKKFCEELTEDLSTYEEKQLVEIMKRIENQEYYGGGWDNMNGGYAECELIDLDDEIVQFNLEYGTCDENGKQEYTDYITIDRKILKSHKMSIEEKIGKTY